MTKSLTTRNIVSLQRFAQNNTKFACAEQEDWEHGRHSSCAQRVKSCAMQLLESGVYTVPDLARDHRCGKSPEKEAPS